MDPEKKKASTESLVISLASSLNATTREVWINGIVLICEEVIRQGGANELADALRPFVNGGRK